MRFPDPERSRALFIGAGRFDSGDFVELPSAVPSATALAEALTTPGVGGFASNRSVVLIDPTVRAVWAAIQRQSSEAEDVLLVYFVGHGLVDTDGELYLAMSETSRDDLRFSALRWDDVRKALSSSRARTRIAILDACFAGRALDVMADADDQLTGLARIQGSVVLTATSSTQLSLAPIGQKYTAFTGELIAILRHGVPRGPLLLTIEVLYWQLRHWLSGNGQPLLRMRAENSAMQVALARNVAVEASAQAETPPPAVPDTPVPQYAYDDYETEIPWVSDTPGAQDHLNRGPLALFLATRLAEFAEQEPDRAFLVHLDGAWGAGKSTLLDYLRAELEGLTDRQKRKVFQVVQFDAWRHSRLSPPWWSLLTTTRATVTANLPRFRRWWFWCRETAMRARRSGAPYAIAVAGLALVAGLVTWRLWPTDSRFASWADTGRVATALFAGIGFIWTGSLVLGRFLLWNSARGARLYEQAGVNPMYEVAQHFAWLLRNCGHRVVVFVDDLDRCPEAYVVELLESIQTLIRPTAADKPDGPAALFVVAADGSWLRQSYQKTYDTFGPCVSEPGATIGYLFLEKIFQLTVPLPSMNDETRERYLGYLLHGRSAPSDELIAEVRAANEEISAGSGDEGAILRTMRKLSPAARMLVARRAVEALATHEARERTAEALATFAPLLGSNPRAMKRFVNTYGLLRTLRTIEGNTVDVDTLALWTIIRVRWPSLADQLERKPDAINGIHESRWAVGLIPEDLRKVAASTQLLRVVQHPRGGPLSPEDVRMCCGLVPPQGAA
ncbi:caspase, EACC1-associated type [Micromonospora chersina]|uniref:caspase, EACC1-associated type n=1 Tax=Micromonospora chersina TaxID=47854 RepID=UPI003710BAC0